MFSPGQSVSDTKNELNNSINTLKSMKAGDFKQKLTRRKTIQEPDHHDDEPTSTEQTPLKKCLTTLDLTSLGVGSCCGTGMYVVAGLVARDVAGPGVILSFGIAAAASILSGICYAEFGVRVPKTTGSAYMYSYVTVGEFIAFVIGWNLILEYMIGTAAGACALSACIDSLTNHSISTYLTDNLTPVIAKTYPDFIAFFIGLAMTGVMASGVSKSVTFNNVLNAINMAVWVFIIVAGLFYVDSDNWTEYGFMPYGFKGVLSGAATCFYAFIGFDIIATTGEEARNPSRSIPIAIVGSLSVCLTAYVSTSVILTLMVPYFEINGDSALVDVFVQAGAIDAAKYIVAFGSVCALTVSLLGSIFPMPRVIYAMARDGLLFSFLGRITEATKTPLIATLLSGILASLIAMLVGLKALVQMMSIGTLLAYTLVSISVLIMRYQPDQIIELRHNIDGPDLEYTAGLQNDISDLSLSDTKHKDDELLIPPKNQKKQYGSLPFGNNIEDTERLGWIRRHFKFAKMYLGIPGDEAVPSDQSARTVGIVVCLLFIFKTCFCLLLDFGGDYLLEGSAWAVLLAIVLLLAIAAGVFTILRQPQSRRKLTFMAPAVPFLPCGAMFINIYLMLKLPPLTWARFGVWLFLGFLIYFLYSMHNSKKEKPKEQEVPYMQPSYSQEFTSVPEDKDNSNVPNGQAIRNHLEQTFQLGNTQDIVPNRAVEKASVPNGRPWSLEDEHPGAP